jgi:hypothetical protein
LQDNPTDPQSAGLLRCGYYAGPGRLVRPKMLARKNCGKVSREEAISQRGGRIPYNWRAFVRVALDANFGREGDSQAADEIPVAWPARFPLGVKT